MNRSRLIGTALIAVGTSIAVLAGLWLAVSVGNDLSARDVVGSAGLVFIPVALLVGLGIYQFVRDSRDEGISSVRLQREMLDLLRDGQPVQINDLALKLGVGAQNVRMMLNDLIRLRVFSGSVNWQTGVVRAVASPTLRALDQCLTCGQPLRLEAQESCPHCGTEYFLA